MSKPKLALGIALLVVTMLLAGLGLASAEEASSHTVRAGETLWDIALRYGTSVQALQETNSLGDADFLRIGQVLILPGSQKVLSGAYHRVEAGETLLAIALDYGVSLKELASLNNLSDPDSLYIGQKLLIPRGATLISPSAPSNTSHIVKPGDTLWGIAREMGVAVSALLQANSLEEGKYLQVGQKIIIPGKAQAVPQPVASSTPPPAKPAAVPLPTDKAQRIVAIAQSLMGTPYQWGGTGPGGFDCSGLVQYVLGQVGISVGHDAGEIFRAVSQIPADALAPGDLVFFVNTYQPGLSHVGIYIGGGQFIHSPYQGTLVRVEPMDNPYYRERFYAAGRI